MIATGLGWFLWSGYPPHAKEEKVKPVGWLSSACLLLRRDALIQVGMIDEEYFIYGDETDLQYRLNRAGWQVFYLPNATTIHYGGRSMDRWRRRKMVYRGKLLFYKKNYNSLRTAALRLILGGLSLAKLFVWLLIWAVPDKRGRARKELDSNVDVVKLCLNPQ